MAGKRDIEAGSAFIRLFLKDGELKSGLRSLGSGLVGAGGALIAAGAAIAAPLISSLKHFQETGSSLHDMSQRTKISVEELSFLRFAADQTGISLAALEKSTQSLTGNGLERAIKGAEKLGIRTKELRAEFARLGGEITTKQAAAADDLGDSWDKLQTVLARTMFTIGAALEPIWKPLLDTIVDLAVAVGKFAKENQTLFQVLAVSAVVLVVVGTALVALGVALVSVVTVATALVTVFTFLAGASAVLIPVAIALALIFATIAEVSVWLLFTKHGQQALRAILAALRVVIAGLDKLTQTIRKTFAGIADAILAGDIELAWKILTTGMTVQWHLFVAEVLKGLATIVDFIEEQLFGGVLARIADISGDLSTESVIREAARGENLEAARKLIELNRLAADAARRRASGGDPQSPGYQPGGMGARGATVIGSNARAALMSSQIMGAGRNPMVDSIMKMIEQEKKVTAILMSIDKKTHGRGMR